MPDGDQGFELLNFLWARYPDSLNPIARGRRFLDYPFPIPGKSNFLKSLADAKTVKERKKAATDYEKPPELISSLSDLAWPYQNLCYLGQWIEKPSHPSSSELSPNAWAIARNSDGA